MEQVEGCYGCRMLARRAADAQATIAALQARVQELEQWVQDQSTANLETMRHTDEMQSRAMEAEQQLTQRTAELEALQRVRDEAKASSDMWKREAYLIGDALRPLCGLSEYEFGWKLAVKIIADKLAALDAERELSAAWAEKAREYELELDGDPQNFHGQGRTTGLREQLSQLQALVRALPVPEEGGFPIVEVDGDYYVNHTSRFSTKAEADAYTGLLIYRATLDATTPAPDTSIIGKCEPPSQWDPNAQVRGDIS